MTRIVNLRSEPYDTHIGRAGRGEDGYFGNPFKVGARCHHCGDTHVDGGSTLTCFRVYFYARLRNDPEFYRRVCGLKGKTLGCFCKPNPCHGDVMVEWLESW